MKHRTPHYSNLKGKGVEIGALHEPAKIPEHCEVVFFDLRTKDDSALLFDELDPNLLVSVDVVGDADRRDLRKLGKDTFDFAIANHVIEHLANPIAFLEDLFYIVKSGGLVVLSAPDKRYTFDKRREITSFAHLEKDYEKGIVDAPDEHYLDFIKNVLPGGDSKRGEELDDLLALVRKRREHVHVWDTESFESFLNMSLVKLGIKAAPVVEITGDETCFEYFSIWQKKKVGIIERLVAAFSRN